MGSSCCTYIGVYALVFLAIFLNCKAAAEGSLLLCSNSALYFPTFKAEHRLPVSKQSGEEEAYAGGKVPTGIRFLVHLPYRGISFNCKKRTMRIIDAKFPVHPLNPYPLVALAHLRLSWHGWYPHPVRIHPFEPNIKKCSLPSTEMLRNFIDRPVTCPQFFAIPSIPPLVHPRMHSFPLHFISNVNGIPWRRRSLVSAFLSSSSLDYPYCGRSFSISAGFNRKCRRSSPSHTYLFSSLPHPSSPLGLNPTVPHDGVEGEHLTEAEFDVLLKKGFFEGDPLHWRNWALLNKGQWQDPGVKQIPKISSIRNFTEPEMKRMPLSAWNSLRGIDYNVKHYPLESDFWNATVGNPEVYTPSDSNTSTPWPPLLFNPRWFPRRDRMGLLYGDARIFKGWDVWKPEFKMRVEEASECVILPQNGQRWQKFYIGPLSETMGWTMGSLLKTMGQSRSPGHAIVALSVDTLHSNSSIIGMKEDLLELSLNMKNIALETIQPEVEGCVSIKMKGPMMLTAGMIEWPSYIQIKNPEHYIATIEENADITLQLKVEWGRGSWLADLEGLYRREEGITNYGYRRKHIKEVEEEGFHPCSCVFGGCRMIRLAVHKLLGSRWDKDQNICPNPKEQLVVEIWSDASATPKEILAFTLQETLAWMAEFRRQLVEDEDWRQEEDQLKATWKDIDAYRLLQRQQKLLGGPPINVLGMEDTNVSEPLESKESDRNVLSSSSPAKKTFSLPKIPPPPPSQDTLGWLKEELERSPYVDKNSPSGEDVKPFLREQRTEGPASVRVEDLQLPQKTILALLQSGIYSLADVQLYRASELLRIPQVGRASVALLKRVLMERFNQTLKTT